MDRVSYLIDISIVERFVRFYRDVTKSSSLILIYLNDAT